MRVSTREQYRNRVAANGHKKRNRRSFRSPQYQPIPFGGYDKISFAELQAIFKVPGEGVTS